MQVRKFWDRYGDHIAVGLTIVLNILLITLFFGFYYDLNDDVMMKDIMAGVYTGTPDGHNMQTLYPLGALIALCYRGCRSIPWYGLFLCLCQFISLFLVGVRLLKLSGKRPFKYIWLIMLTFFVWSVLLPHLSAVQYTVTSGIMTAAAIFLFMTSEKGLPAKTFLCRNIPSVLLVILAFWLRTEMLLLLLPLVALAGLVHWLEEGKFWRKENYLKYGSVLGTILVGMVCGILIDAAAYRSPEWKSFRHFFDDRTRVYDYHLDMLTEGMHAEQLADLGFSESAQELLENYNFGLDESIDEYAMRRLADYADAYAEQNTDMRTLLSKKIEQYRYRILHLQDGVYGILTMIGYSMLFGSGIAVAVMYRGRNRFRFLTEVLLLVAVRTALWLFIILRGRDPVRITHPLYLTEFAVIMGMAALWLGGAQQGEMWFLRERTEKKRKNREKTICVIMGVWAAALLGMVPNCIESTRQDIMQRQSANNEAQAIVKYCREHAESFYFEDVYSTVSFSQKMFADADNSPANYDIMGGWICKSPLYTQKLGNFGITSMADGLLYGEQVYMIMRDDLPESSTEWLKNYYAEQGNFVTVSEVDRVGKYYGVYQVREVQ